jgi:hypothetical protein
MVGVTVVVLEPRPQLLRLVVAVLVGIPVTAGQALLQVLPEETALEVEPVAVLLAGRQMPQVLVAVLVF